MISEPKYESTVTETYEDYDIRVVSTTDIPMFSLCC